MRFGVRNDEYRRLGGGGGVTEESGNEDLGLELRHCWSLGGSYQRPTKAHGGTASS